LRRPYFFRTAPPPNSSPTIDALYGRCSPPRCLSGRRRTLPSPRLAYRCEVDTIPLRDCFHLPLLFAKSIFSRGHNTPLAADESLPARASLVGARTSTTHASQSPNGSSASPICDLFSHLIPVGTILISDIPVLPRPFTTDSFFLPLNNLLLSPFAADASLPRRV
jgi:hypothetical protein